MASPVFISATNPPVEAFHNSLDDANASIAPGYPQKPFCHPFRPAANVHTKPEVTFSPVLLCRKNSSRHLHLTRKSFIS